MLLLLPGVGGDVPVEKGAEAVSVGKVGDEEDIVVDAEKSESVAQ